MKNALNSAVMLAFLMMVVLATSCDDDDDEPKLPDSISFTFGGLYPEGFDYDSRNNRFLVSSITEGDVFRVSETGTIERFTNDTRLISSTGVTVDETRNRVIVATGDVNASKRSSTNTAFVTASIGIYDLNTGATQSFITLGDLRPNAAHFASEATVDNSGNIYITDSFAPVIYRVDASGNKSVWLENANSFTPAQGAFGLNGIVFHPDGYLLVVKSDNGFLYKVPINNPSSFTRIDVAAYPGTDGIALDGNNNLLLAINSTNRVVRLTTNNAWASASQSGEVATPNVFPTMVNDARGDFFVLHSYLGKLLSGDLTQQTYLLEKVRF